MLDGAFYFILNMSLSACVVIAVLLLLRKSMKLPGRVAYPLWTLAFLRLLVPFAPRSRWSLFNLMGGLIQRLIPAETLGGGWRAVPDRLLFANVLGAAEDYNPFAYKTAALERIFAVGAAVWLAVAAVLLLTGLVLYLRARRTLRGAVRVREGVYAADGLSAPMLVGILKPNIFLPHGLDPDSPAGAFVLAHETVHRRRLDNLWRLAAIAVACIHWFNPLVWVMLRVFFDDMERACDEAVLRQGRGGADERSAYAAALLTFAEDGRQFFSAAFGTSKAKTRIANVLSYRRMTALGVAACALFLLAAIVVLTTNPMGV